MTKLTILWLGIVSVLCSLLIMIFNGSAYAVCFSPEISVFTLHIPYLTPMAACMASIFLTIVLLLFIGPLLITLCFYTVYVVIYNNEMAFAKSILWFSWLIFLYFAIFELYFIQSI